VEHRPRLSAVAKRLESEGLDALFVSNLTNIRYLSGFTGSNAYLLVTSDVCRLFTDGRYAIQAAAEVHDAEVSICLSHAAVASELAHIAVDGKFVRVGFEAAGVTVGSGPGWSSPPGLDKVQGYFESAEVVPTTGWIEEMRQVKDASEVERIRRAAEIADAAMAYVLERIKPGRSEIEIALDLEFHMRTHGAEAVSFDPIVAAGPRSAIVHARPTDRPVADGDLVLLDMGCIYQGYCSDMTRTVAIGHADDRQREVYAAVLAGQAAALEQIQVGIETGESDKAARESLIKAGFGDAFTHGLGHGVGLEIHEAPTLRSGVEGKLEPGNVVTAEPGAYFAGWGGVRIEDLVAVQESGAEILSRTPKDFLVL